MSENLFNCNLSFNRLMTLKLSVFFSRQKLYRCAFELWRWAVNCQRRLSFFFANLEICLHKAVFRSISCLISEILFLFLNYITLMAFFPHGAIRSIITGHPISLLFAQHIRRVLFVDKKSICAFPHWKNRNKSWELLDSLDFMEVSSFGWVWFMWARVIRWSLYLLI